MTLKSLAELLAEASEQLQDAEVAYEVIPCTRTIIALYEATEKYEQINSLLDEITVDLDPEPKSLKKRKRNRNRRILENNDNIEVQSVA